MKSVICQRHQRSPAGSLQQQSSPASSQRQPWLCLSHLITMSPVAAQPQQRPSQASTCATRGRQNSCDRHHAMITKASIATYAHAYLSECASPGRPCTDLHDLCTHQQHVDWLQRCRNALGPHMTVRPCRCSANLHSIPVLTVPVNMYTCNAHRHQHRACNFYSSEHTRSTQAHHQSILYLCVSSAAMKTVVRRSAVAKLSVRASRS